MLAQQKQLDNRKLVPLLLCKTPWQSSAMQDSIVVLTIQNWQCLHNRKCWTTEKTCATLALQDPIADANKEESLSRIDIVTSKTNPGDYNESCRPFCCHSMAGRAKHVGQTRMSNSYEPRRLRTIVFYEHVVQDVVQTISAKSQTNIVRTACVTCLEGAVIKNRQVPLPRQKLRTDFRANLCNVASNIGNNMTSCVCRNIGTFVKAIMQSRG